MPPDTLEDPSEVPPDSPATDTPLKVVAFDFDGTLTYTDSFTTFLKFTSGSAQILAAFVEQPSLLGDYIQTRDRGALKSRLLFKLLGPISKPVLEAWIASFIEATGNSLFRPDAMTEWQAQDRPDRLRVIVTASPEMLVAPFGELLGADRVIGTRQSLRESTAVARKRCAACGRCSVRT
jgi:phosphatidylglycerophosphatase C